MIHAIPVATPFAVGRVNCYLIDDDPLTLVDTGPNSAAALMALEAGLAEHGRRVEDLERLVITHQHSDHAGLAHILAQRSGAEVCALDRLAPWLARYGREMRVDDEFVVTVMERHGIPYDMATVVLSMRRQSREWGGAVDVTHPLPAGGELAFAARTWRVLHRPGHSPSDTVFHDEASGALLAGDHLIKHISSNPLLTPPLEDRDAAQRPQALVTYMSSMAKTRELDLEIVLSGHGEAITDHKRLIDERFASYEQRAAKILRIVAGRPRTAFEIAEEIWRNIAVEQAYFTLSVVLGHVDILLNRGQVVEQDAESVIRFEASS